MSDTGFFKLELETNMLDCDPQNPTFVQNPYELYEQLHKNSPSFFWKQYGHWCFAGWDQVNALLRDRRFGRQILHKMSRDELGWPEPLEHTKDFDLSEKYSLLALEAPAHTRLRLLVNRAFISRQIEQLRPQVERLANWSIDRFEDKKQIDFIKEFATPIPILIITQMLDIPSEMGQQLLDWSHKIVAMYMFGRSREDEIIANQAAKEFSDYLRGVITDRRKNLGDDLLSHMITTQVKGDHLSEENLSEDELISTTILLLNAGHEATVHQSGNALKTILQSSYDPKKLFANDEQTAATIEEAIRFDAPLHMFTRYALEDVELENGIVLKQGEEIGLMLAAANRDPARFENAQKFDPFRKNNINVTFSAGIHFCIGAPLARLEMQAGLKVLFERLPNLKLAEAPQYSNSYHFHGLQKLMVSW